MSDSELDKELKLEAYKCRLNLMLRGYNVSNLDDVSILEKFYELEKESQDETDSN